MRLLFDQSADVDAKDNSGWTPLSRAAEKGHEAIMQQLLATEKVDVDVKDNFGWTPLSYTAERGHEPVVELLELHAVKLSLIIALPPHTLPISTLQLYIFYI